jgi:hypothetical protein
MSNTEANKELGQHATNFIKALYQLCVHLAKLIIIGGKFAFDAMYNQVVASDNKKQQSQ